MNMCCYMYYCMEWFTSLGIECDAFMHHTRELEVVVASSFLQ
jgi:hypothetical protein